MYDVSRTLPTERPQEGSSLLATGPPMVGKQKFSRRFAAEGLATGDTVVVVTTDTNPRTLRDRISAYDPGQLAIDERLFVIDATRGNHGEPASLQVTNVSSPADLTGLGVAVSELFEAAEAGSVRLVVDSLSTLAMYNEFERLYRFLHVVKTRTTRIGGLGCFVVHPDAMAEELDTLIGLFDGSIEFRETGLKRTQELRFRNRSGISSEWHPLSDVVHAQPDAVTTDATTEETDIPADHPSVPSSLHAFVDRYREGRLTLTLVNTDETTVGTLKPLFQRLSISMQTANRSSEMPTDTALLHDDSELVATAPVESLRRAARLVDEGESLGEIEQVDLLERADRGGYGIEDGGKAFLCRVSRMIESRAGQVGAGELHVGFQNVSRLDDEPRTRRMYERLAETDVKLHLYGARGTVDLPSGDITIHTEQESELADAWFLGYDGAGVDDRKICMVTEERDPERYYGFWTRRPDRTNQLLTYLRDEYGTQDLPARSGVSDRATYSGVK